MLQGLAFSSRVCASKFGGFANIWATSAAAIEPELTENPPTSPPKRSIVLEGGSGANWISGLTSPWAEFPDNASTPSTYKVVLFASCVTAIKCHAPAANEEDAISEELAEKRMPG